MIKIKYTVSAVSMHTLSAVIKITRLLFSIVFIPVCLQMLKRRLNPDAKFENVVIKFGTNR